MKQSRLTGAISLILAQAVVLLLGYVTHVWIGRVLGPGPYGLYRIVLSIQTIAGMLLTYGVPVGISRFVAQDEHHARSILQQAIKLQVVLSILIALATLLAAPLLASILNDSSLKNLISFVAIIIVLQAGYTVFIQYLSGMHRFNRQAALTIIYAVSKLIGALILIYIFGVYGAFAGFAIGGIIAAVIGWAWTRHLGGAQAKRLPYKAFFSFAGTYVVILIGLQILISLDLFMVKATLQDEIATGYYSAATTLAQIPYMLLFGLAFILLPSISALTKSGQSRQKAIGFIRETLRYLIALILPAAVLAAATSKNLLTLFFSRQYNAAAMPLTILMIGLSALAFYLLLVNIVAGAGQAKIGLFTTAGMLILSALLGYYLIPRYGLAGAAWQTTAASLLGLFILGTYTLKTFQLSLPYRSLFNICLATVAAVSLTYIWDASPLTLLPQYALALVIYLLSLIVLGEITPADRVHLANLHPALSRFRPRT